MSSRSRFSSARVVAFVSVVVCALASSGCGGSKGAGPGTPSKDQGEGRASSNASSLVDAPLIFAKRIGALEPGDNVRGAAFAADGDLVVTGSFEDKVDFGGVMLTSRGASDIFVARYSNTGALRWVRRFGGAKADLGQAVAVAPDGSIVVAGSFMATADFGKKELTSAGNEGNADLFVTKMNEHGVPEWTRAMGNDGNDGAFGVAVDATGIVVAGVLAKWQGATLTPGGAKDTDALVALYSNTGDRTWWKTFGNGGADLAGAVAIDGAGSIVLVSDFAVPVPAAGGIPALGPHALTVTKLRREGTPAWEKSIGCESMVSPEAVAIGEGDRVFFGGTLYARGTWGTTTIEPPGTAVGVVGSVTTDGTASWLVPILSNEGASLTALAKMPGGGVLAAGHGEGLLSVGTERATGRALFSTTIDAAGKVTSLGTLKAPAGGDRIARVATDGKGRVAFVGSIESELRFAPTAAPLPNRGRTDGFIALFGR